MPMPMPMSMPIADAEMLVPRFPNGRFSDIYMIMELKELNRLCKHMKNVRSSQPRISMNFCTEFSKAQVFPCEYR